MRYVRSLVLIVACLLGSTSGCGRGSLDHLETRIGSPWCGKNQQVQVGDRTVGQTFYGPISREFWIDDSGHEYDPEEVGKKVWEYIGKTSLKGSIESAVKQQKACAQMQIISVKPVVVLMFPSEYQRRNGVGNNLSMGTRHPLELCYVPKSDLVFAEPMQWFSPDLDVKPTTIQFNASGEALLPIKKGNIKLLHFDDKCKISRE